MSQIIDAERGKRAKRAVDGDLRRRKEWPWCLLDPRSLHFLRLQCVNAPSNGLIDSVCCYCNFAYSNSECLSRRRSLSTGVLDY